MKRATIKEVARAAGVSVATVSRAMSDSPAVRPETSERIREVARSLRYVPHNGARSLATNRTSTIGVLLPDIHGQFFSELIRGIDRTSRGSGYQLLVSGFHSDRREVEAVLRATRGRVDGLILMTPDVDSRLPPTGLLDAVPTVLLNCSVQDGALDSLEVDNVGGAVAVVRHLASLGHHSIAMITGPEENSDARERLRGYRQAVRELGLAGREALELRGDFTDEAGSRAAAAIVAMAERPTAVFAANDDMAIGALWGFREAGVEVPGSIAIVGFDDIPAARFVSPALTSVRVEIAELGALAAQRLLEAIENGTAHQRRRTTLPATLVVRDSCGGGVRCTQGSDGTEPHTRSELLQSSRGGRDDA